MECGPFLDVVIRKCATILELLASKDKVLLIGRYFFLILDLGLVIVNGVRWLDLQCDHLAPQGLDEDLHTTMETKDKVEGQLFLNVVVRERSSILKLLTSKDEALGLVEFLKVGIDIINCVRWFNARRRGLLVKICIPPWR